MTSPQTADCPVPYDVIVVGAGLTGLVVAARYLQAHPDHNLALLEQDYCLGGVWSKRRNYPEFWSQTSFGLAEFADLPMETPPEEDCKIGGMFKAKYVTRYLERYAEHIWIGDQTLHDRICFNTRVQALDKVDGRWHLKCTTTPNSNQPSPKVFIAEKLLMAEGLCTIPRMPTLPGQASFKGPIIHSLDFGQSSILVDATIHHITVLGGGKSALDMVYSAVKAGKTVSWVLRKTGDNSTGPGYFAPGDTVKGYKTPGHMAQTRFWASLQPSFLLEVTWWTRFLQCTSWGVGLVNLLFGVVDRRLRDRARYKDRQSDKGFEKLEFESG